MATTLVGLGTSIPLCGTNPTPNLGALLSAAGRFNAWDEDESRRNAEQHGVSSEEAAALFQSGVDLLEVCDEAHAIHEDRFIAIGPIAPGTVYVIWTERPDDIVRIISARWATVREIERDHSFMRRHP